MDGFFWNVFDFLMEKIFFPCFVIFLVLFVLAVPLMIYGCILEEKSPVFELKKKDWECSKTIEYDTILIPQTHHHVDCVQWNKK